MLRSFQALYHSWVIPVKANLRLLYVYSINSPIKRHKMGVDQTNILFKKSLIRLTFTEDRVLTPVPGSKDTTGTPTSGEVHMFADPASLHTNTPLLFVDCEGLEGGNIDPGATGRGQRDLAALDSQLKNHFRSPHIRDFRAAKIGGVWGASSLNRSFCVEELYPRILYAFSDVICFVTDLANAAEKTMEQLIKWADKVLSKTVNQPSLPHAILVINGLKTHPEDWLDEQIATEKMLRNRGEMSLRDPKLAAIATGWRQVMPRGTNLVSVYDLLLQYFSSIRVVYIPDVSKCTPDVLFLQYKQLKDRVTAQSRVAQSTKRESWNLLNASELSAYFDAAFSHFCDHFDEPFDFFKISRRNNPIVEGFDQHICNLMRRLGNEKDPADHLSKRIAPIVASSISVDMTTSKLYST